MFRSLFVSFILWPLFLSAAAAAGGKWAVLRPNLGIVAMHMQLQHTDKVVIFDRTDFGPSNISFPKSKGCWFLDRAFTDSVFVRAILFFLIIFTPVDGGAYATLDATASDNLSSDDEIGKPQNSTPGSPNFTKPSDTEDEEDYEGPPMKKQRQISSLPSPLLSDINGASPSPSPANPTGETPGTVKTASKSSKKSKKKNTKPVSRKGKKKGKNNGTRANNAGEAEDMVMITPTQRFPNKDDDTPDAKICLSKFYKADKVELSVDRMSAGITKGYRMVRATRGVTEGAWYFEIEGDVIGFYINLPEGSLFTPKAPRCVVYRGKTWGPMPAPDAKDDPPQVVPGSEICFFKNGQCQGTAFILNFGNCFSFRE